MKQRITFDGRFIEYFLISLGLLFLTVVTLGLAGIYWFYWSRKYFFSKLRIGDQRIVCTGGFGEFFFTALGLSLLSVLTLGLALPYFAYWQFKYFAAHLELTPAAGTPHTLDSDPLSAEPLMALPGRTAPSAARSAAVPQPEEASGEEQTPQRYQFRSPQ